MDIDRTAQVIVALPSKDGGIEPPVLMPPDGVSYHWANTTLLGEPDIKHLSHMLGDGWGYASPIAHPNTLSMTMAEAMQARAFCLMQRATADVQEQRARERTPHMDADFRMLAILERYTGEKPVFRTPSGMMISVRGRKTTGDVPDAPPPIDTLGELRAELLKRFAEADVRLFMQRHFNA